MAMNYSQPSAYYWYYATKEEALNWPIAPGNMLTFKDPDGKHYYEKSLGWAPYEGVRFVEFVIQEPVVAKAPEPTPAEQHDISVDIQELKNQMSEFMKAMRGNQYYNNNKKGENK